MNVPTPAPPSARDVAVIGLACRFPRSPDPKAFWKTLIDGVNTVGLVPPDRWDVARYYDPRPHRPGKMNTRWGAFLDHIDCFDADFFRITPREAKTMDPQQRLLLELAWEALENAGLPQERLEGTRTGVFVGICSSEYGMLLGNDQGAAADRYFGTGTALSVAAGRISYCLNLRGPAISIETACSSSLVAVHQAVASLRAGESEVCLAGGVNVVLSPAVSIYFSQLGAVSNSQECKAFDADADGYVRGEGCGMIVLKRLPEALAAGDHILAVIRGSAVNHDGRSAGLTAPSGKAQEEVLRAALDDARMSAADVDYIEAHGTGTRLGDPIEANAIGMVYGAARGGEPPLRVGSVKANIGHLEAAAGIAGVIKVILALTHGSIPRQINCKVPNPLIDWKRLRLEVAHNGGPWQRHERAAAAVSSFGFSGTNAHVIVTRHEGESCPGETLSGDPLLLPISARSQAALAALAKECITILSGLRDADGADLAAFCRGFATRRSHHPYRLCAVGRDAGELIRDLRERTPSAGSQRASSNSRPLAFVFPGQGAQWASLAACLLEIPPAAAVLERIDGLTRETAGWSLLEQIRGGTQTALAEDEAHVAQTCTFALQVALASLWEAWGVRPNAVLGHSMGEIAAAHVAGALTLEDATRLVVVRSRLLREVAGTGLMAMTEVTRDQAKRLVEAFEGRVAIAGHNSFSSTTFSGDSDSIRRLIRHLESESVFARALRTGGVPGHGPLVAHLGPRLREALGQIVPRATDIAFYSATAGEPVESTSLTTQYWVSNLTAPVQFASALARLSSDGGESFVELGPKPALVTSIRQVCGALGRACSAVTSLAPGHTPRETLSASLATLYEAGIDPDWFAVYPGKARWSAPPAYPWQRVRHWFTDIPPPVTASSIDSALQSCIDRWDNLGVRSLNMPNLAPWALVCPRAEGVFYLSVRDAQCTVWAYVGAADGFEEQIRWLLSEARQNARRVAVIANGAAQGTLESLGLRGAPVGVLHRIDNLGAYTTEGPEMRRLRAQLLRYGRSGGGRTARYIPGEDPGTDRAICSLIEAWQKLKGRPVPAAEALKADILRADPLQGRRLYVTRAGARLHNAILLTQFGNGEGFLLDLEFYGEHAPPGASESAIVQIIGALNTEGFRTLSLGGSYALRASDPDDPAYQGQLRFKRKFRPAEDSLRLYTDPSDSAQALDELLAALIEGSRTDTPPRIRAISSLTELPVVPSPIPRGISQPPGTLPLRRLRIAGPTAVFECSLDCNNALVAEHRVRDTALLPGAAFVAVAANALHTLLPSAWCLHDFTLRRPLPLGNDDRVALQVILWPTSSREFQVSIASRAERSDGSWTEHVSALARSGAEVTPLADRLPDDADTIATVPDGFYASLESMGIVLGRSFRLLACARRWRHVIEADIDPPAARADGIAGRVADYPAVIDAGLQALAVASPVLESPVLLQSIERLWVASTAWDGGPLRARAAISDSTGGDLYSGDLDILEGSGRPLLSLRGVLARKAADPLDVEPTPATVTDASTHVLEWRAVSLPRARRLQGSRWLLAGGDIALLTELESRLKQSGADVETLPIWDRASGMRLLVNHIRGESTRPDGLVLLPVGASAATPTQVHHADATALLPALVRSLSQNAAASQGLRLWLVTRAVHHPDPQHPSVGDAALWGAGSVLRVEQPEWHCGMVDLEPAAPADRASEALAAIIAADACEELWSISGEHARVARLVPFRGRRSVPWQPTAQGSYLVTGWTSGLGRQIARWLLDRGARHLLLVARTAGTPELLSEVDDWIARFGADIRRFQIDVAEWSAIRGVFELADSTQAPVRGVFHAAGQIADSLLLAQRTQDFRSALSAKVAGTWNLHRLTQSRPLDAFVVFSSAVTMFAPPSQAAHAAACAASDHIVRYRASIKLPALSIGWGPWLAAGKAAQLHISEKLARFGIGGLPSDQAFRCLEELLRCDCPHVYRVPVDWSAWRKNGGAFARTPLFSAILDAAADTQEAPALSDPLPATHTEEAVAARIVRSVAQTLMRREEEIDTARSLEANGLDSIMVVELRERLSRELGATLPLIDFFREPSIVSLSRRARVSILRHDVRLGTAS